MAVLQRVSAGSGAVRARVARWTWRCAHMEKDPEPAVDAIATRFSSMLDTHTLCWVERLQTSFELVRTTPNDDLLRTSFERSFGVLPIQMYGGGVTEAKIDLDLRTPNDRSN